MAEQWYAIYDTASGDLVSTGTVLADPMPANLTVVPVAQPDFRNQRWNKLLKQLEAWVDPPPVVVLLIDLLESQPEIQGLGAVPKATIHTVLQRLGADKGSFMDRLEAQAEISGLSTAQKNGLHNMLLRLGLQQPRGD